MINPENTTQIAITIIIQQQANHNISCNSYPASDYSPCLYQKSSITANLLQEQQGAFKYILQINFQLNQNLTEKQMLSEQVTNISISQSNSKMDPCDHKQQMIYSICQPPCSSQEERNQSFDLQTVSIIKEKKDQYCQISSYQLIKMDQTSTPSPPLTPQNKHQPYSSLYQDLENIMASITLKQNIQPKKGVYYKNRKFFFTWMRNQCSKLRLQKQTFANCICMMDFYYKRVSFNAESFLRKTLCMLIISSKSIQSKILFTSTIAKNNSIDVNLMLQTEIQLLNWFKFQVNSYNYMRTIAQFMQRWDHVIKKSNITTNHTLFFEESIQSYLFYEKFVFLCQKFLKEKGNLLKPVILKILNYIGHLKYSSLQVKHILTEVFKDNQNVSINEINYIYHYSYNEENPININDQLDTFSECFKQKHIQYHDFYHKERSKYTSYAQFLTVLY